jgi:hypothetical protein
MSKINNSPIDSKKYFSAAETVIFGVGVTDLLLQSVCPGCRNVSKKCLYFIIKYG